MTRRTDGINKGWTTEQLIYMRWKCWPVSEKDPNYLTKTEVAKLLDVGENTLHNWELWPGWDDAEQAMANQVMLELDPLFYRNIAENMLSAKPSDKIIQTYYRYIRPAILRTRPDWEKLIQPKTEQVVSAEGRRSQLIAEIMELPTEQRDTILAFWKRLIAEPEAGDAQVLPAPVHRDFRRQPKQAAGKTPIQAPKSRSKPLVLLPVIPPRKSNIIQTQRRDSDED